jgi:hypothetical protein
MSLGSSSLISSIRLELEFKVLDVVADMIILSVDIVVQFNNLKVDC